MSVQAMTWALEQRFVSDPSARHILLCLANYADKYGKAAFPSVLSLSEDTGLSERTIRYKLDLLQQEGLIRLGNQAISAAYISRHDRRPTVYDLALERGAPDAGREVRGANDDRTGCKSQHNGVQMTTERGATAAPNPSLIRPLTINKPKEPLGSSGDEPSEYSEEFKQFWSAYPKRDGGNSKKGAWKKWNARLREGVTAEDLILAAKRYAAQMQAKNNIGTSFVKQAETFLGPDQHWKESLASNVHPISDASRPRIVKGTRDTKPPKTRPGDFHHWNMAENRWELMNEEWNEPNSGKSWEYLRRIGEA
jgi:Helix-turn-helix domain